MQQSMIAKNEESKGEIFPENWCRAKFDTAELLVSVQEILSFLNTGEIDWLVAFD